MLSLLFSICRGGTWRLDVCLLSQIDWRKRRRETALRESLVGMGDGHLPSLRGPWVHRSCSRRRQVRSGICQDRVWVLLFLLLSVNVTGLCFYTSLGHYFVNGGFFKKEGQLIADVHKIRHIPAVIVQGRYVSFVGGGAQREKRDRERERSILSIDYPSAKVWRGVSFQNGMGFAQGMAWGRACSRPRCRSFHEGTRYTQWACRGLW